MNSVPTAVSAVASSAVIPGPFDSLILYLNSNPYFIGLMMLMLNLGGRFLAMEVSKEQEKFFQHPWVRRFLIFTIFFVGTRNVFVALVMSAVVILLMGYLLNENSSLCIFKAGTAGSTCATKEGFGSVPAGAPVPGMTMEEQMIYKQLHEKQLRLQAQAKAQAGEKAEPNVGEVVEKKKESAQNLAEVYWANIAAVRNVPADVNPRF